MQDIKMGWFVIVVVIIPHSGGASRDAEGGKYEKGEGLNQSADKRRDVGYMNARREERKR